MGSNEISQGMLPDVSDQKDFMDQLSYMMESELTEAVEEEEGGLETRGARRELKSYLVESDKKEFSTQSFRIGEYQGSLRETHLPYIKILDFKAASDPLFVSFYLDTSDKRFWVLHTQALARNTHYIVQQLTHKREFLLDRAWMPSQLLETIANLKGNEREGVASAITDYFNRDKTVRENSFKMGASGIYTNLALEVMKEAKLRNATTFNSFRIARGDSKGTNSRFSSDDLDFDGTISVKRGKSIDAHIAIVEQVRDRYKQLINEVEQYQLGTEEVNGINLIKGKSIDLYFKREIEDFDFFFDQLLDAKLPFNLWGFKQEISKGYYRIMAIDLHTGHPLDLEIAQDLIRVYLPKGSCGNTVLRLYVNLQHAFDTRIKSEEILAA